MYQYNDCLTQLFTKYKFIWRWLQCFDPFLGHLQAYKSLPSINIFGFGYNVSTLIWVIVNLSSLYSPDDDPDKGRNIVAKAKYIYTW
jgi:hypothetical protein